MWNGASTPAGYGRFKIDGRLYSPHRLVFQWLVGKIDQDMMVCHTCDNPRCVRPDHLFLGTARDNVMDALMKGRLVPPPPLLGVLATAKLNEASVRHIKTLHANEELTRSELSDKFGVSYRSICRVLNNETWRHVH